LKLLGNWIPFYYNHLKKIEINKGMDKKKILNLIQTRERNFYLKLYTLKKIDARLGKWEEF
jgi:hypothetical protein